MAKLFVVAWLLRQPFYFPLSPTSTTSKWTMCWRPRRAGSWWTSSLSQPCSLCFIWAWALPVVLTGVGHTPTGRILVRYVGSSCQSVFPSQNLGLLWAPQLQLFNQLFNRPKIGTNIINQFWNHYKINLWFSIYKKSNLSNFRQLQTSRIKDILDYDTCMYD